VDFINKHSYEYFPIRANFGNDLVLGELITGLSVSCINADTGENTILDIVDWETPSSPEIIMGLKGGVDQEHHIITVLGSTSLGNEYQREIHVFIYDGQQDVFSKKPDEILTILADLTKEIESADTVSSYIVTALQVSTGVAITSIFSGYSRTLAKVYIGVTGGVDLEDYIITVKLATASGYKYTRVINMSVRDI
jgi:hypothetical protein